MRALFEFGKKPRLRFVSHLDLQRFMQMALRRTQLPVAYSQGFNPHPQMSFASALAMGWTSQAEILDVKLSHDVETEFAKSQMSAALPPDLPLGRVRLVEDGHPKLMARLSMADYAITLHGPEGAALAAQAPIFLARESVVALRKTKSGEKPTDIRTMCISLEPKQTEDGACLFARLMLTEQATLKPDLLLSVLGEWAGVEAEHARPQIHRTALLGLDGDENATDLFML